MPSDWTCECGRTNIRVVATCLGCGKPRPVPSSDGPAPPAPPAVSPLPPPTPQVVRTEHEARAIEEARRAELAEQERKVAEAVAAVAEERRRALAAERAELEARLARKVEEKQEARAAATAERAAARKAAELEARRRAVSVPLFGCWLIAGVALGGFGLLGLAIIEAQRPKAGAPLPAEPETVASAGALAESPGDRHVRLAAAAPRWDEAVYRVRAGSGYRFLLADPRRPVDLASPDLVLARADELDGAIVDVDGLGQPARWFYTTTRKNGVQTDQPTRLYALLRGKGEAIWAVSGLVPSRTDPAAKAFLSRTRRRGRLARAAATVPAWIRVKLGSPISPRAVAAHEDGVRRWGDRTPPRLTDARGVLLTGELASDELDDRSRGGPFRSKKSAPWLALFVAGSVAVVVAVARWSLGLVRRAILLVR